MEVERLTGLYSKPAELVVVVRARIVGGELRPTDEADRYAWMHPGELPPNVSPNQVERIRDALTDAAAPARRAQPGYAASRPEEWLPVLAVARLGASLIDEVGDHDDRAPPQKVWTAAHTERGDEPKERDG